MHVLGRSKLDVDGLRLVNNEGLHGMVEKCGTKDLSSGAHIVYIQGFQAGGGVGMVATYSGPDTGGEKKLMRSGAGRRRRRYFDQCDPTASGDSSQFTICMFRSRVGLSRTPKIGKADRDGGSLKFVGKGRVSKVDLHSLQDFRAAVPGTPDANYAWAIFGQLMIGTSGSYRLCISSDDG